MILLRVGSGREYGGAGEGPVLEPARQGPGDQAAPGPAGRREA